MAHRARAAAYPSVVQIEDGDLTMQMIGKSDRRPAAISMAAAWALLAAAVALLSVAGCSNSGGEAQPAELKQAPGFELTLFGNQNHDEGSTLSLSDLDGKAVVLNFWYPSCPPCRLEMPDLEAASVKHAEAGVAFVGIQSLVLDTVDDGQEFIDEFGITYAVGPDASGDILIDYDVSGFPTTIFLNRDHQVVRKWAGILDGEKLDELIAEALN